MNTGDRETQDVFFVFQEFSSSGWERLRDLAREHHVDPALVF